MSITRRLPAFVLTTAAAGAVLVSAAGAAHAGPVLQPRSHWIQAAFTIFVDPADQPGKSWSLTTGVRDVKANTYQYPETVWGCKNGVYVKGLVTPRLMGNGEPRTGEVQISTELNMYRVNDCNNAAGTIVKFLAQTTSTYYVKRYETVSHSDRVDNLTQVSQSGDWDTATLYTTIYDLPKTPA